MLLKHRFRKTYRHPSLDRSLTRQRLSAEARALLRAKRAGVAVPTVLLTDLEGGLIGMEWIEGSTLRSLIPTSAKTTSLAKSRTQTELGGLTPSIPSTNSAGEGSITDSMSPETLQRIMFCVGQQLAKMHCTDIIHGDLTTSNIMLRTSHASDARSKNADPEIVLIDFGLTQTSALAEDRAVDLYVLERAFSSTHPGSEDLFEAILEGYEHGWSSEQNHSLYASGWQLVTKAQGATEHRTIRNRLDEGQFQDVTCIRTNHS